jgi:hypothetical protein
LPPDEPAVFFLDRTFRRHEFAGMLRDAEFVVVTIYDEFGNAESKIADPVTIQRLRTKGPRPPYWR